MSADAGLAYEQGKELGASGQRKCGLEIHLLSGPPGGMGNGVGGGDYLDGQTSLWPKKIPHGSVFRLVSGNLITAAP